MTQDQDVCRACNGFGGTRQGITGKPYPSYQAERFPGDWSACQFCAPPGLSGAADIQALGSLATLSKRVRDVGARQYRRASRSLHYN